MSITPGRYPGIIATKRYTTLKGLNVIFLQLFFYFAPIMSTYRQILYQLVFATKYREHTIRDAHCEELYKYIWGVIDNNKCKLYRINGVGDHIHIACDLHPSIALAGLIKDIKLSSSEWMKKQDHFNLFKG